LFQKKSPASKITIENGYCFIRDTSSLKSLLPKEKGSIAEQLFSAKSEYDAESPLLLGEGMIEVRFYRLN